MTFNIMKCRIRSKSPTPFYVVKLIKVYTWVVYVLHLVNTIVV